MNYRAYHFGNFYLSSIQQGIQTAHCQTEMARKFRSNVRDETDMFWAWAKCPVTICLNGGNLKTMKDTLDFFNGVFLEMKNKGLCIFPFDVFYEDKDSLGGLLTNIGIILPEKVWDAFEASKTDCSSHENSFEAMLKDHLNNRSDFTSSSYLDFESKHGSLNLYEAKIVDYIKTFGLAK